MKKCLLFILVICFAINLTFAQFKPSAEYNNEGYSHLLSNNFKEAIKCFDQAISIDPENSLYFQNRASAKVQSNDTLGAISDYNQAIKLDSSDYENYFTLGYIYSNRKEYNLAIKNYTTAILLNPEVSELYFYRANAYSKIKKLELALADLNKAIEIDQFYSLSFFNRAMVNYKLGHKETACDDWNIALANGINEATSMLEKYCINHKTSEELLTKHTYIKKDTIQFEDFQYDNSNDENLKKDIYQYKSNSLDSASISAEFPGGNYALLKWIVYNINYPRELRDYGVHGRVIVGFAINTEGIVEEAKILQSSHPLFNNEALRVVNEMPVWTPAKLNNKPVKSYMQVPISFKSYPNGLPNNTGFSLAGYTPESNKFPTYKVIEIAIEKYKNNDFNLALKNFNEVILTEPNNIEALYYRGLTYQSLNKFSEACNDWSSAMKLGDKTSDSLFNQYCSKNSVIDKFHTTAYDFIKKEDYTNAIKCYSEILKLDPNDTIALYIRGNSYKNIGDLESACNDWNRLQELGGKRGIKFQNIYCTKKLSEFYYNKAREYFLKDNYSKSIEYYTFIIKSNSICPEAYLGRAKAYHKLKDNINACNDINKAIEHGNNEAKKLKDNYCEE